MAKLIVLRGPFTDADTRRIVVTMQQIESARPTETFDISIDSSDDPQPDDVTALFDRINPPRPGYERVVRYWSNDE